MLRIALDDYYMASYMRTKKYQLNIKTLLLMIHTYFSHATTAWNCANGYPSTVCPRKDRMYNVVERRVFNIPYSHGRGDKFGPGMTRKTRLSNYKNSVQGLIPATIYTHERYISIGQNVRLLFPGDEPCSPNRPFRDSLPIDVHWNTDDVKRELLVFFDSPYPEVDSDVIEQELFEVQSNNPDIPIIYLTGTNGNFVPNRSSTAYLHTGEFKLSWNSAMLIRILNELLPKINNWEKSALAPTWKYSGLSVESLLKFDIDELNALPISNTFKQLRPHEHFSPKERWHQEMRAIIDNKLNEYR